MESDSPIDMGLFRPAGNVPLYLCPAASALARYMVLAITRLRLTLRFRSKSVAHIDF
jgi:hypothetical protein